MRILLEKPRLRRRSARTGACVARARRAWHLLKTGANRGVFKVTFLAKPQNRVTLPFFPGFSRVFLGLEPQTRPTSKVTEKRFITKSKQHKKSGGSIPGIKALGRAAFFVAAPFGIRPVNRLHLFLNVLLVLEINEVKDVLPLMRRKEPEHGY